MYNPGMVRANSDTRVSGIVDNTQRLGLDLANETPLRVDEVSEIFKVHPRTVKGWFKRGLACCRIGRILFTTREAVIRFAQPSQPEAQEPAESDTSRRARLATEAMRARFGL